MLIAGGAGSPSPHGRAGVGATTHGATALKATLTMRRRGDEPRSASSPPPRPPSPQPAKPGPPSPTKRAEALMKGYQGDACGECGNFTLVRNGTCLKCDTCGATTGCS